MDATSYFEDADADADDPRRLGDPPIEAMGSAASLIVSFFELMFSYEGPVFNG